LAAHPAGGILGRSGTLEKGVVLPERAFSDMDNSYARGHQTLEQCE
jgi:hypothetical protein